MAQAHTAEERHATSVAQREWALHALTCSKGPGKRGTVHDAISSVFQVLLENAGFDEWRHESARVNAEGISGRKASPEWSSTDC